MLKIIIILLKRLKDYGHIPLSHGDSVLFPKEAYLVLFHSVPGFIESLFSEVFLSDPSDTIESSRLLDTFLQIIRPSAQYNNS
jgi:hypothetical protein